MERSTRQRSAIEETLSKVGQPMLPQALLAAAQQIVPSLSLATVYRNLKALEAEGRIEAVTLPGEPARYEMRKHHHHHFHCKGFDQVIDIDACPGNLSHLLPRGFVLEDHQITLYGKCPACR